VAPPGQLHAATEPLVCGVAETGTNTGCRSYRTRTVDADQATQAKASGQPAAVLR